MFKLSAIQKITFSALMTVMVIICTRLLSFQNVIPFIRISLGPAIIILASITLGPVYGGIVGGASDILGIVLFPNALGFSINPLFTMVYTLFGILPFFIYKFLNYLKNEKIKFFVVIAFYCVILLGSIIFLFLSNDVTILNYHLDLTGKFIFMGILLLLVSGLIVTIYFTKRFFTKKTENLDTYSIALAISISELLVMTFLNSWVKSYMFEVNFSFVLLMQLIVFFIDVTLYTIFVAYMVYLLRKIVVRRG